MNLQRLLSSDTSSPLSKVIPIHHQLHHHPHQHQRAPSLSSVVSVVSVDQSSDPAPPAHVDPHVIAFLKKHLGDAKWRIFSSRLCERRSINPAQIGNPLCGGNGNGNGNGSGKSKKREEGSVVIDQSQSPCAIEFLVKVEVVKEVLRLYVPHPYHPQKTLEHRWEAAPSGQVHITRTTVLALSGWSNTQFAYWARRSEAVSVLARHDHRLRDLACVLYQRLYNRHLPADAFTPSSPGSSHAPSSASSSSSSSFGSSPSSSPIPSLAAFDAEDPERQLQVAKLFTGKGLDGTIANVKKRTGASQFLRGRQSSLDAFGSNFDCQSPPCSIVDLSIGSSSRQNLGGTSPFTFMSPRHTSRREELDSWSLRGSATSPLPTPAFTISTWSTRTSDAGGSGSSSPAHHAGGAMGPGLEYWTPATSLKRKYRPSEDIDDFPLHHHHDRTVCMSTTKPDFKRRKIEQPPPPQNAAGPGPHLYH